MLAEEMKLTKKPIKNLSPLMKESFFFAELPNKIKIHSTINLALKWQDLQKFMKKAGFLKSIKNHEHKEKSVETIEEFDWKINVNGTAAMGRFLTKDDEKLHGWGKKVDVWGNLLIGNFRFGNFINGVVYNRKGFIYSILDCRNNRYLDCLVQIYTTFTMDYIYSGRIAKGKLNGKGKISILKQGNWFLDNPENMIMYNNIECKTFKDGEIDGNAWIVDARFPNQSDVNTAFEIKVEFEMGKISFIYFSLSQSLKLIHDTDASKFNDHDCLILQKYDNSVSYYGKLDGFFENKKSIKITEDFISYETKHYQRAVGVCCYNYPSHDSFMEIDWRFDEEFDEQNVQVQVGDGIQYMEKAGLMIYGRWIRNYQLEKPSVWRFDKIITMAGGCYKGSCPSNSQGLYFQFVEKIQETPRYNKRHRIKQYKKLKTEDGVQYNNYITVMVDGTDTIYSDIHISSGESLRDVNKAFVFNNGIYAEGDVHLDKHYNTCSLTGKGVYVENDLNFHFEGEMKKDDFKKGKLTSGYAILEGIFDDFIFREGKAWLKFHGGIVYEGAFKDQNPNGYGKIVDLDGKLIADGEWKNGVLLPERHWMLTHGDKNQRYHRLCLFRVKEETPNGEIPEFEGKEVEEITTLQNVNMRTLTIYEKIFFFKYAKMKFTDLKNLKLFNSYGEMACSIKSNSLKRYETIKNPETYGSKTLTMVLYNFKKSETMWKKCGMFSQDCHKVLTINLDFKGIFKTMLDISQKTFHSVEKINYFHYDFQKDKLNFKKMLQCNDINSVEDLRLYYYVYRDLDERIVIRLKKDDARLEKNKVKGRDKFNGVILHIDGSISYGEVERCFLNGKGTKLHHSKNFYMDGKSFVEEEDVEFVQKKEGSFFCDQLIGPATLYYSNGAVYNGETKLGKRHGKGTILFPNGEAYNGDWFSNIKHGYGVYKWKPLGAVYVGEFKMNMMWGEGIFSFADGNQIIGQFWKNEPANDVQYYDNEGNVLRIGEGDMKIGRRESRKR